MNSRKHRREPKSTYINVAPLVEVMLVLIIIFMITVPVLNVGVPVDLPKTKATSLNDTKTPPVVISIDKESRLYIEEAEISLNDLINKLPAILENNKSDTIYIRGDKNLQYGEVMKIMGIIASSGACKVSLISETDASNNKTIPEKNRSNTWKTKPHS